MNSSCQKPTPKKGAIKTLTQMPSYPPTPQCTPGQQALGKTKPNASMPSCIYLFPKRIGMPYTSARKSTRHWLGIWLIDIQGVWP